MRARAARARAGGSRARPEAARLRAESRRAPDERRGSRTRSSCAQRMGRRSRRVPSSAAPSARERRARSSRPVADRRVANLQSFCTFQRGGAQRRGSATMCAAAARARCGGCIVAPPHHCARRPTAASCEPRCRLETCARRRSLGSAAWRGARGPRESDGEITRPPLARARCAARACARASSPASLATACARGNHVGVASGLGRSCARRVPACTDRGLMVAQRRRAARENVAREPRLSAENGQPRRVDRRAKTSTDDARA